MNRPKIMDTRIALSVTDELIKAVDEWRRYQPDLPPRSEAIRRLVDRGLLLSAHAECITNLLDVLTDASTRGALTEEEFDRVSATLREHDEAAWREWMERRPADGP